MSKVHKQGPSWRDLGRMIVNMARGLQRSDREDLRQDVLLRNVEKHREEGYVPYPAYRYAQAVTGKWAHKYRIRNARLVDPTRLHKMKLHRDLQWDSWIVIDPEAALDLKREILRLSERRTVRLDVSTDLAGKVFGDWVVVGLVGSNRHGKRMWSLTCQRCGETHTALAAHLKRGAVMHCTTAKTERLRKAQPLGVEAALAKRRARGAS